MSSEYVEGGRPQGLQHVNGEALAGSGLCHLPIRPNQVDILFALPEEGFTHPPDSSGIVGEEVFSLSGWLRWRRFLVPRHMSLCCGQHPPAWSIQPPTVGSGAACQYPSARGTSCAIHVSRTSGQDPSRTWFDAAPSKCVAIRAIPPGYRQPSRADVLGIA